MGDYHSIKDYKLFNDNAEKKLFTLREAIDFLRARTFKEGTGSKGYEITYQNKLYNVQISIIKTEEN